MPGNAARPRFPAGKGIVRHNIIQIRYGIYSKKLSPPQRLNRQSNLASFDSTPWRIRQGVLLRTLLK
jgi:hypothetical protein